MSTPNIGLTTLSNSQGQYLNANETFSIIDALLGKVVKDKDLSTPPGSPSNGDVYIVGGSPTDAWSGHATHIAFWYSDSSVWKFIVPKEGWKFEPVDEDVVYRFDGSAWVSWSGGGGGMSNPMTTAGDIIVGGSGGTPGRLGVGADGKVLKVVGGAPAWADESGGASLIQSIVVACSDETTALTSGTAKLTFRMPYAFTLTGVRASLTTAQSSGSILTVDINEGGTTILSTKLTIDNTEKTSTTAATAPVISDSALADDAEITIDIDQIGDGTAKGLKVALIGYIP